MNAASPGRLNYEAHQRVRWPGNNVPWDHPANAKGRPAWEAGAQAVLNQAFPGLRGQINDLRAQRDDYAARLKAADQSWAELAAERDRYRELLDEIGGMTANAPEDGDCFGLLEEITMRIAGADVPDDEDDDPTRDPASPEQPVYRKIDQDGDGATRTFMITCDEGWRSSIVCADVYEHVADWLLTILGRTPYAKTGDNS